MVMSLLVMKLEEAPGFEHYGVRCNTRVEKLVVPGRAASLVVVSTRLWA